MTPAAACALDRARALLSEHFDSGRVFVTEVDAEGRSLGYSAGLGNYYAQVGQVTEWVQQQQARVATHVHNVEGRRD